MSALSLSSFSFFKSTYQRVEPQADGNNPNDDVERRKIVGDMIAAGACDSEYGVQMLMSVFPDQF